MSAAASVTALVRYPLKSGRGEPLEKAAVEPWGLGGDRRWMILDARGRMVTGRQVPRLVQVEARSDADGLWLGAQGHAPVQVLRPVGSDRVEVDVFGDRFAATPAPGAEAWVRAVTGEPGGLVHLDDPRVRPADPRYARDGDVVSFADGFPLLLTAQASLDALNGWVAAGPRATDGPLPMGRFRPNVVVAGAPAWEEDRWRRLRIGDVVFRSVKACERCAFTLVDPVTAERTKEPLLSLARHRRRDGKTWFGINLVPDDPRGVIRVGDPVEVLAEVDDPEPQH